MTAQKNGQHYTYTGSRSGWCITKFIRYRVDPAEQPAHDERRQRVSRTAHVAVKNEIVDDVSLNSLATLSDQSQEDNQSILQLVSLQKFKGYYLESFLTYLVFLSIIKTIKY